MHGKLLSMSLIACAFAVAMHSSVALVQKLVCHCHHYVTNGGALHIKEESKYLSFVGVLKHSSPHAVEAHVYGSSLGSHRSTRASRPGKLPKDVVFGCRPSMFCKQFKNSNLLRAWQAYRSLRRRLCTKNCWVQARQSADLSLESSLVSHYIAA